RSDDRDREWRHPGDDLDTTADAEVEVILVRTLHLDAEHATTGSLVSAVLSATDPSVPGWAFLENGGHNKRSAVAAAVKKFPALDALGPPVRGTLRPRLASLPDREIEERWSAPIERDVARSLAAAIPKQIALNYSNFVVGPVPALWLCDSPPP